MKEVFAAWMLWLSQSGIDSDAHILAPATEKDLDKLEQIVGKKLPDDLRALYLISNGQADWYKMEPPAGKYAASLFGSYDFLSIASAIREYSSWQQIWDDSGENFHADFNEGIITVRNGDPVAAEYWQPGWLPFARDGGGNYYGVDLSPVEGGTYGQIILVGPDEDQRRVLASGISKFLSERMQKPLNPEIHEEKTAFFDMEARDAPSIEPPSNKPDTEAFSNSSSRLMARIKQFFS